MNNHKTKKKSTQRTNTKKGCLYLHPPWSQFHTCTRTHVHWCLCWCYYLALNLIFHLNNFNLATHKPLLLRSPINYMQSCNNIVSPLLISVSHRQSFPSSLFFVRSQSQCGFRFFFLGHKTLAFAFARAFSSLLFFLPPFCTLQLFSHAHVSLSGSSAPLLCSFHFLCAAIFLHPCFLWHLGGKILVKMN